MELIKRMFVPAIIVILFIVSLNLIAAVTLKASAENNDRLIISAALFGLVIVINVVKFVLWGIIHRKIDLSKSLPLTAIFFPLIAIIAYLNGQDISAVQWLGVAVITAGVLYHSYAEAEQDESETIS